MFSDCIRAKIQPATWAVVGKKKDLLGGRIGHRGTAFAIDTYGHLLTCWHVTFMDKECQEEIDSFEVVQPEVDAKRVLKAKLLFRDKDSDLAVLKIEDDDVRTAPVTLNAGPRISWGTSCCAFGHPLSIAAKQSIRIFSRATSGLLSTPLVGPAFDGGRSVRMYETDFFTHGGISGGPLFLTNGCVFGVISRSLLLDQDGGGQIRSNLSVATDVAEAIELLKPLGVKPQLAGHVGGNVVPKKPNHPGSSRGRRGRGR